MQAIGFKAFCTVFLFQHDRVLLLKRSDQSPFAPGRWSGVGGRVEVAELEDLTRAALREVEEETGIRPEEVRDLRIRVVLTQPEGGDVVLVLFWTGQTGSEAVGPCKEGDLHWVRVTEIGDLDWIGNARPAFERAYRAMQSGQGVHFGVCDQDGDLRVRSMAFLDHPPDLTEDRK